MDRQTEKVKLKGERALQNYLDAMKAVKEGRIDDARAIELLPSDRKLIEQKIVDALAKTTEKKT